MDASQTQVNKVVPEAQLHVVSLNASAFPFSTSDLWAWAVGTSHRAEIITVTKNLGHLRTFSGLFTLREHVLEFITLN